MGLRLSESPPQIYIIRIITKVGRGPAPLNVHLFIIQVLNVLIPANLVSFLKIYRKKLLKIHRKLNKKAFQIIAAPGNDKRQ